MDEDSAQIIALQALTWLIGNEELCPVFLGATGGAIDDLKDRAAEVEFQVAVLEFITMDDSWVVQFCDSAHLEYDQPMRARLALPGAAQIHWT